MGAEGKSCHSEERSDEESLCFLAFVEERFLASLGMTGSEIFFNKLLGAEAGPAGLVGHEEICRAARLLPGARTEDTLGANALFAAVNSVNW